MKFNYAIAAALLVGAACGAGVADVLHGQARPQAYVIGEIDITDPAGYAREFGPLARKALAEAPGYRALVLGGKTVAIAGEPPKKRVIVNLFDNMDAAVKAYTSPDFLAAKKIGDKYATFRTYAVEAR